MKFWKNVKNTDEDKAIERLKGHKNTITCVIEILKKEGINKVRRTENNCKKGDFEYEAPLKQVTEALDKYFKDDKI